MKTVILGIVFNLAIGSLLAQEIVSSFLDKYGKDENIEVVTIGKKMLDKMQSDSIADDNLQEAIHGLENINIISCKDKTLNNDYYDLAYDLLTKNKNFTELVSIHTGEESLIVMVKEAKGIVNELILLANKSGDFNLISLRGAIKLDMLAKYSQKLNFNELEKLKSHDKK
jgi:hypothetical protein